MDNMPDTGFEATIEAMWHEISDQRDYIDSLRDYITKLEQRVRDLELLMMGIAVAANVPALHTPDGDRVIGPA